MFLAEHRETFSLRSQFVIAALSLGQYLVLLQLIILLWGIKTIMGPPCTLLRWLFEGKT
jgi:hypothetical protein